jgi:uncharacterized protein (DUF58 family)
MSQIDKNSQLLQVAARLYGELSQDQVLMIDRISLLLRGAGMHGLNRPGIGVAPLSLRPFDPDRGDTRADISPLHSTSERFIVKEREREIQNRYFAWIDSTPSMDFVSRSDLLNKREAGLVLTLAMARKLLAQGDSVTFSQDGASRSLTTQAIGNPVGTGLTDFSGASFEVGRNIPLGSTVILVGDFYDEQDTLRILDEIRQRRLNACMIVVADPQEVSFDLPERMIVGLEGNQGPNGEMSFDFYKAVQKPAQQLYRNHIETLQHACEERGFSFYFQRTDQLTDNNCLVEMMQQASSPARRGVQSYHLGSLSGLDLG